jgi:hypothetical protein
VTGRLESDGIEARLQMIYHCPNGDKNKQNCTHSVSLKGYFFPIFARSKFRKNT